MVAWALSNPWQGQIWQVSYPGGEASRSTHDLNNYVGVSLTADSGTLATVSTQATSNIWVAAKDDWDHPQQVTRGLSNADGTYGLSWSDRGEIIYTSLANGNTSLWAVNPGTGSARKLVGTAVPDFEPSTCGGTGYLVFVTGLKGGSLNIWQANADGSGLTQLTSTFFDTLPSCSPDGKWVVYRSWVSGRSQLYKTSIDNGKSVLLSNGYAAGGAVISPDGKRIACLYKPDAQKPFELAILPFAGAGPIETYQLPAAFFTARPENSFAWTSDGRAIAYVEEKNGVSNIVLQPLGGGTPRQLTHYDSGRIFAFDISRDGQLALARGTQSSDVVLIRNFQ